MPRRRKDTPEEVFSTTEVAIGAALSRRNILYLVERGLLPDEGGGSYGSHRDLGDEALGRAAIVGGLSIAGLEIVAAAKIAECLAEDMEIGSKASNFRAYLDDKDFIFPDTYEETKNLHSNYFAHKNLLNSPIYKSGAPKISDHIITIEDGIYVYHCNLIENDSQITIGLPKPFGLTNFSTAQTSDEINIIDVHPGMQKYDEMKLLYEKHSFTVRISVNISLCIRNAYDRISKFRKG